MHINYGIKDVNVENEIEVYTKREFQNCNFQQFFLIRIFQLFEATLIKFCRLVTLVGGHLEGTGLRMFI